jgi:hypothetical protein
MAARILNVGMMGEDVTALHKALSEQGLKIPDSEARRGFFGPATRNAVLEMQKRQRLPATGQVDTATDMEMFGTVGSLAASITGVSRALPEAPLIQEAEPTRVDPTRTGPTRVGPVPVRELPESPTQEAEDEVAYPIVGRLLDSGSGLPLASYGVYASDLEAGGDGKDLGYDIPDPGGMFQLTLMVSAGAMESPVDKLMITRHLRLRITEPRNGREIHRADLRITLPQDQPLEVRVAVPVAEERPGIQLANLAPRLGPGFVAALAQRGLHSLADVRLAGGVDRIDGLSLPADDPAARLLDAHVKLSPLSGDAAFHAKLVDAGLGDPRAIAALPRAEFVSRFHDHAGDLEALRIHAEAQTASRLIDNLNFGFAAEAASGYSGALAQAGPESQAAFQRRCSCCDCESAVGPAAYLAELLSYANKHLRIEENGGTLPVTLAMLSEKLHQPLAEQAAACGEADKKLRQIRIGVEVLRSFIGDSPKPPALVRAEQDYALTAYGIILGKLGTSLNQLRQRGLDPQIQQRLADRLGILVSDLNLLPLDQAGVIEAALERLFGLRNTDRISTDTGAGIINPQFLARQLEYLRALWAKQDWPELSDQPGLPYPLIDPDLIGPADLKHLQEDSPALQLWRNRRTQVDGWLREIATERTNGIASAIRWALPSTTLLDLKKLRDDLNAGENIEQALRELSLPLSAFTRLLEVADLASANASLLDNEREDFDSILVQAKKEKSYPNWRSEERGPARQLILGPDDFRIAFDEPAALPTWRASRQRRRDWQDVLRARIDQEKALIANLEAAVDAAEEAALPDLRNALVLASNALGDTLDEKADWIGRNLLVDAKMSACMKTTRIAQATESIQKLLYGIRAGYLPEWGVVLSLDADDFDAEWEWLGSYQTWRAAMLVFLYPENLLYPHLRNRQTPAFRELVEQLRGRARLTPRDACEAAKDYERYFRDVCSMRVEAACQAAAFLFQKNKCGGQIPGKGRTMIYFFGRGTATQRVYWSTGALEPRCDPDQSHWTPVSGIDDAYTIIGAVPYYVAHEESYICLFVQVLEKGIHKLKLTRYRLERGKWDDEPVELEVPPQRNGNAAIAFSAVVGQGGLNTVPPHLAFLVGGAIFDRYLNREATDWDGGSKGDQRVYEGAWHLFAAWSKGREFQRLVAMIEIDQDNFYLVAHDRNNNIRYRLSGAADDGRWHPNVPGRLSAVSRAIPGVSSGGSGRVVSGTGGVIVAADDDSGAAGESLWTGKPIGAFVLNGGELYIFWISGRGKVAILERTISPSVSSFVDRLTDAIRPTDTYYRAVRPGPSAKQSISYPANRPIQLFDTWLQEVTGLSLSDQPISLGNEYNGTLRAFLEKPPEYYTEKTKTYAYEQGHLVSHESDKLKLYFARLREVLTVFGDSARSSGNGSDWRWADAMVERFTNAGSLRRALEIIAKLQHNLSDSSIPSEIKLWRRSDNLFPARMAANRLEQVIPAPSPKDASVTVAIQIAGAGAFRTGFRPKDNGVLEELNRAQLSPKCPSSVQSIGISSSDALKTRRQLMTRAFDDNKNAPRSHLDYLEEAFYFIPMQLAWALRQSAQYLAALDWFSTVYAYRLPEQERKLYPGLVREESLADVFDRAGDWLTDRLNPHAIAATRVNAYTRFTIFSIAQCLLEFADAEFSRDTAESVARARDLYSTTSALLSSQGLDAAARECQRLIERLDTQYLTRIQTDVPEWLPVWVELKLRLARIGNQDLLAEVISQVELALSTQQSITEGLISALARLAEPNAEPMAMSMSAVVNSRPIGQTVSPNALMSRIVVRDELWCRGNRVVNDITVATANPDRIFKAETLDFSWLRTPLTAMPIAAAAKVNSAGPVLTIHPALASAEQPAAVTIPSKAALPAGPNAAAFDPSFPSVLCVPPNPVISGLIAHAELNLYKIRTCRNIAGDERTLEFYATDADMMNVLPGIGIGGQVLTAGPVVYRPTPYRYAVLIDRAKQLVSLALQMEAAFLSALEKFDAESYSILRARQEVRLARAGVQLQNLRVKEAEDGVTLAELQKDRAEIQQDYYQGLINEGMLNSEIAALGFMVEAIALSNASANILGVGSVWEGIKSVVSFGLFGNPLGNAAQALSAAATAASSTASYLQTLASYERHEQEWNFQLNLAQQDVRIGNQQIRIAKDHVRVAGQERAIAQIQTEHAEATVEFLANKFTNADLYEWMSRILEGVYSFFLQHATAAARLAQNQLAFERQQMPPAYIQADYWEASASGLIGKFAGGESPDRRGLTGSARLLQDITKLDQYAFESDRTKLQLTKTFSLARIAPAEFQRFRESGVLRFSTPMALFDQDFPGHYLRLIKRVRTSVLALIPPVDGIKATFSSSGISRVVIEDGGTFKVVETIRPPESVALTSARDATGLFELIPQPQDRLFPFEGMGVDASWELQIPKAANQFNYQTLVEVLITVEYTALNSSDHRAQVIKQLDRSISADRPFSFRNEFADQFYELNHPEPGSQVVSVRFETRREDFPPNLDELRIQHIVLFISRVDGAEFEVTVDHLYFTEAKPGSPPVMGDSATTIDGIISTRRGNAGDWSKLTNRIRALEPIGEWELALPKEASDKLRNGQITDLLFVITYSATTPAWPT